MMLKQEYNKGKATGILCFGGTEMLMNRDQIKRAIEENLITLDSNVNDLSHWVKMLAWAIPAIVAIGIAVIGVIVFLK